MEMLEYATELYIIV